jgi:hypothetical protein
MMGIGLMDERQRVAHTHGYAKMKDRGEQAFSAQGYMAKPFFLFLCHTNSCCQVKQVALGRHQRFSHLIYRTQCKGGKASAGQIARRFCYQMQQARLV